MKNENNLLPYDFTKKKVALIGPSIFASMMLMGNYFGLPPYLISPYLAFLEDMKNKSEIITVKGCKDVPCKSTENFNDAILAA
jgi:beta-D-xylosidase 4